MRRIHQPRRRLLFKDKIQADFLAVISFVLTASFPRFFYSLFIIYLSIRLSISIIYLHLPAQPPLLGFASPAKNESFAVLVRAALTTKNSPNVLGAK